jgi:hypothetical protein
LTITADLQEVIAEMGGACAVRSIFSRELSTVIEDIENEELIAELREGSCKELIKYGVYVLDVRLTDCTTAKSFRILGPGGHTVTPVPI